MLPAWGSLSPPIMSVSAPTVLSGHTLCRAPWDYTAHNHSAPALLLGCPWHRVSQDSLPHACFTSNHLPGCALHYTEGIRTPPHTHTHTPRVCTYFCSNHPARVTSAHQMTTNSCLVQLQLISQSCQAHAIYMEYFYRGSPLQDRERLLFCLICGNKQRVNQERIQRICSK